MSTIGLLLCIDRKHVMCMWMLTRSNYSGGRFESVKGQKESLRMYWQCLTGDRVNGFPGLNKPIWTHLIVCLSLSLPFFPPSSIFSIPLLSQHVLSCYKRSVRWELLCWRQTWQTLLFTPSDPSSKRERLILMTAAHISWCVICFLKW